MSLQDTVFDIVKEKGPVLPAQIVSEVGSRTGKQTDMFFIGAILSELMSAGQVKMSHAKLGGSRMYYCPGQESKLESLYEHLNDKEQKAFDLLKEKKILRNSEQEPVIRVALSQLKDFAKPIEVKLQQNETFWRWHSLPLDDAKKMIRDMVRTEVPGSKKQDDKAMPAMEGKPVQVQPTPERKENQDTSSSVSQGMKSNGESSEKQSLGLQSQAHDSQESFIASSLRNSNIGNERKDETSSSRSSSPVKRKETQADLTSVQDDDFMNSVKRFLSKKGVSVKSGNLLKKNSECEFEIEVDSSVGKLNMYAYGKAKKKLNENDLSYAYLRAKNRNLELCFVSTGELTKKASDLMSDELRQVVFLQMEG